MKEADKIDFSICEFIEESMWFFTYDDFCENRLLLKRRYDFLKRPEKRLYMWYVYANIHTSMEQKNKIWNYLNDYDSDGEQLLKYYKKGQKKKTA